MEDAENCLTACFRELQDGLGENLVALDQGIDSMDQAIRKLVQAYAGTQGLQPLHGIGPITGQQPTQGCLPVHFADSRSTSVIKAAKDKEDRLSRLHGLCSQCHKNIAAVALANKTMVRA